MLFLTLNVDPASTTNCEFQAGLRILTERSITQIVAGHNAGKMRIPG